MESISVIIPLYNEQESILELNKKILNVFSSNSINDYEIIYVNDGSNDDSEKIIDEIAQKNSFVKLISFRKNYGKAAALSVGFQHAQKDYIITMDADLQDDPQEIIELIQKLGKDSDLVSGWKKKRYDPLFRKKVPSKLFNWIVSKVSGIHLHDFNCGLKAYKKDCAKSLSFYGEMHRFLPVLAFWNGFRVTEKPVKHHARKYGKTKYGINRFINGFLDLLTISFLRKYTKNPMHLFGFFGILFFAVGIAIICYFGVIWIIERALHIRPLMLLGVGAILMGIQLFSIGFVGEMITHTGQKEKYHIKTKINL